MGYLPHTLEHADMPTMYSVEQRFGWQDIGLRVKAKLRDAEVLYPPIHIQACVPF